MSVFSIGRTIGAVPRRWGAQALMLSPVVHERERQNEMHAHEAAFVALMLRGDYREMAAQTSIRYERFSAVYHPPMVEHQDSIGAPGVRLLMFEFRPDLVDDVPADRARLRSLRDISGTRAAWDLLSLYHDAVENHDELDFESRALQLAGSIVDVPIPRDRPALDRARDFVHAHFRDRITMHEIARAAAIHPVYLGQMFRGETGETISNYVNRLRVRAAAEQLTATKMAIAAIAQDHGFCDQSHFQRIFKRLSGFTPAAFRAKFAGD